MSANKFSSTYYILKAHNIFILPLYFLFILLLYFLFYFIRPFASLNILIILFFL